MKSCQQIVMLVSEAQDRELGRWESFSLGVHLNLCRHCRRYASSIEQLRTIMNSYADLDELPSEPSAASGD